MQPVGRQRHGFRQRPIIQPQEHASQLLRQLGVDPLGVPREEQSLEAFAAKPFDHAWNVNCRLSVYKRFHTMKKGDLASCIQGAPSMIIRGRRPWMHGAGPCMTKPKLQRLFLGAKFPAPSLSAELIPCSREIIPWLSRREFPRKLLDSQMFSRRISPKSGRFREIPCIFPCDQGTCHAIEP